MQDPVALVALAVVCCLLYAFSNWCATKVPRDDTHDFRGHRKEPLTREDLEEINRRCMGKTAAQRRFIIRNYKGK